MAPMSGQAGTAPGDAGQRIGMRLWLGAAFAGVGVITAVAVYVFVSSSTEKVLSDRSTELAVGRTISLADRIGDAKGDAAGVIAGATGTGFQAWFFDEDGRLVAPDTPNRALDAIKFLNRAIEAALAGGRFTRAIPGKQVTVVSVPVFGRRRGVVLVRFARDQVLQSAIDTIQTDTRKALLIAVGIGILAGFVVATAISRRVKRLAS